MSGRKSSGGLSVSEASQLHGGAHGGPHAVKALLRAAPEPKRGPPCTGARAPRALGGRRCRVPGRRVFALPPAPQELGRVRREGLTLGEELDELVHVRPHLLSLRLHLLGLEVGLVGFVLRLHLLWCGPTPPPPPPPPLPPPQRSTSTSISAPASGSFRPRQLPAPQPTISLRAVSRVQRATSGHPEAAEAARQSQPQQAWVVSCGVPKIGAAKTALLARGPHLVLRHCHVGTQSARLGLR